MVSSLRSIKPSLLISYTIIIIGVISFLLIVPATNCKSALKCALTLGLIFYMHFAIPIWVFTFWFVPTLLILLSYRVQKVNLKIRSHFLIIFATLLWLATLVYIDINRNGLSEILIPLPILAFSYAALFIFWNWMINAPKKKLTIALIILYASLFALSPLVFGYRQCGTYARHMCWESAGPYIKKWKI